MVWDDHDIRDGFGSLACDSPTLAAQHPRGAKIFAKTNAYFEDARDVYWHFQGCHNPLPGDDRDPALRCRTLHSPIHRPTAAARARLGMPFVFRCGRLMVLVLDSRGERDVFRKQYPILGAGSGSSSRGVRAICRRTSTRWPSSRHADRVARSATVRCRG